MIIERNAFEDSYTAECDYCHDQWMFEGYEVEVEPYPHLLCPHCGHWIPLF